MSNYHKSVLLQEVIDCLRIVKGEQYIDATLGGGGHSLEIIRNGGKVLGIDVDEDALDFVEEKIKIENLHINTKEDFKLVKGNFRDIGKIAKENGFKQVAGILFDFGVSSHQIDDPKRGFSFQQVGPLDMRMDKALTVTARDLINGLHRNELIDVFRNFGEERFAHGIATEIVEVRKAQEITTTDELIEIINQVMPARLDRTAAAARIFQSLRIVINDELHVIEEALPQAIELLKSNGRIVAISFHSLEDRIVKHQFQSLETKGLGKIITRHPILATEDEVKRNNRSRSAKLRVFEKI